MKVIYSSRLEYMLEEQKEKVASAKQDVRKEIEQEMAKERSDVRALLEVANRKREELEFKLSQKEEEVSYNKQGRPFL